MNLYQIPNKLIIGLGLAFYPYALIIGMPFDQILWHSLICVIALIAAAFVICPIFRIGGGMAKLMAIAFLWLGVSGGFVFMAISYTLTFVCSFAMKSFTERNDAPYLPFAVLTAVIMIAFGGYNTPTAEAVAAEQSTQQ